ncbi:MAG: T9SS type A sorting domain-containing protein, partial [Bacteroidales bacterium]
AFGYGDMLTYIPELDVYVCSAGNYMKIGQEFLHRDIYNFLKNNINSIDEPGTGADICLYPNPVSNMLFINGLMQDINLSVIDMNGRVLIQQADERKVDVSHLSVGIYVIHIMTKEGKNLFTGKFIKQTNQ